MGNNKGFTLIELIIVMAIMSILLGIAVVSGKAWMDRYQVESQMKELYSDLVSARINAMQKQRIYFVSLPVGGTQYAVYEDRDPAHPADAAANGDGTLQTATDALVKQKGLPCSITSAVAEIDFNPNGLASPQTTIYVNQRYNATYDCIVVFPTVIRMGAWDATQGKCNIK